MKPWTAASGRDARTRFSIWSAAARVGADVMLVERSNHLGGLSTGGLVIWIDRMTDWEGTQVIAGIGSELLDRLPESAIAGPGPELWGSTDPSEVAYWRERLSAFPVSVEMLSRFRSKKEAREVVAGLKDGSVDIVNTTGAGTPLTTGDKALLTIDVWEHAYYIDYRNLRPKYVETFLSSLVNWEFAEKNFA